MANSTVALISLFKDAYFAIPRYQRAYAWDSEKQGATYLEDLRNHARSVVSAIGQGNLSKRYFFGTLLLHDVKEKRGDLTRFDIVDGQQRLTTTILFLAAWVAFRQRRPDVSDGENAVRPSKVHEHFLHNDDYNLDKLTVLAGDNPLFQSLTQNPTKPLPTVANLSGHRIVAMFEYFRDNVGDGEWTVLVPIVLDAQVMVYSVESAGDATQIFELQNDRGKKLTELESIKSYLMHALYLTVEHPEQDLDRIQTQFSLIYRYIEQLERIDGAPEEDSILSYFCVHALPWSAAEWRSPKAFIAKLTKERLTALSSPEVRDWILSLVTDIEASYAATLELMSSFDRYRPLAELHLMSRMATFWPLILRVYIGDPSPQKHQFTTSVRLMEIYSFQAYAIGNVRSDTGLTAFNGLARDFKGQYAELWSAIIGLGQAWEIPKRFMEGLNRAKIFESDREDAQYLLYKYENHLRRQSGQQQPELTWRDYVQIVNKAKGFSIEHVAPQEGPLTSTVVAWMDGTEPEPFYEVALHRLGNLVLDSVSPNASKGNASFSTKLRSFERRSIYLSQGELAAFAIEKDDQSDPVWDLEAIRRRHDHLVNFARSEWDYQRYLPK